MTEIIIKDHPKHFVPHMNRALGKYIHNKRQYLDEMKKGGYVPQKEGDQIAEATQKARRKQYKASDNTRQFVNSLKTDKKGNLKMSGRQKEYYFRMTGQNKKVDKIRDGEGGFE